MGARGAAWCVAALLFAGCASEPAEVGPWKYENRTRWASLASAQGSGPGFHQLDSSRTRLRFVNRVTKDLIAQNRNMLHGSGVAVGDVNGDDWPDLFITGLARPNRLYLNRRNFRFEVIPDAGGAAMEDAFSTGSALADLDGDRDLDLVVTTMGGQNRVFHNDGTGQFTERPNAGLHKGRGSTTMALADLNGDGALDLYVGNYKRIALRDSLPPDQMTFRNLARQVGPNEYEVLPKYQEDFAVRWIDDKPSLEELAEPDRLYLNDGDGTFTEQPWPKAFRTANGTPMRNVPTGWALVARLEDLNGDGHADLYVCNDFKSPDLLFWGTGDGHFTEAEETALRATSHATMSIATSDIERDGDTDFFLADMLGRGYERRQTQMPSQIPVPTPVGAAQQRTQEMQNTLQLNRGDGTFAEIAEMARVEASGWTWSSRFLDVNLDGFEDLIVSNGHAYDVQDADSRLRMNRLESRTQSHEQMRRLIFKHPRLDLKTMAFRNRGDGTFEAMPDGWGLGITADVGHGMATGDLDRDGDLDVVVNRFNRALGVYRNEAIGSRVGIQLVGRAPNTEAIGAAVRVVPLNGGTNALPAQTSRVIAGGEYLSDSEAVLSFAMGTANRARVTVTWPDGMTSETDVQPGRIYEIIHPDAQPPWTTPPADSTVASRTTAPPDYPSLLF